MENMQEKSDKRREDLRKSQRKYYQNNRERILTQAKERYDDKTAARKKAWKEDNVEFIRQQGKEWRAANADKIRNDKRVRKFGITYEQYQRMLIDQDYKCKICQRHQDNFKRAFAVDHCHTTGKVRALLCGPCNSAFGLLQESIETIDNLKLYAIKAQKERDSEHARSD